MKRIMLGLAVLLLTPLEVLHGADTTGSDVLTPTTTASSTLIGVDCTKTVRTFAVNPTGFCLSYPTDDDGGKGLHPFPQVLTSMGVGSLRYPMGALAENYLFHDLRQGPPTEGHLKPRVINTHAAPAQWTWATNPDGSFKPEILDFDEFVTLCRASCTVPVVLVATHGHKFPGAACAEEMVLKNAEEWVRYANMTRKLGIRYWELGNEVDLKKPQEVMSKDEYMDIYQKLARRMKAVDPSIHTGLGTDLGVEYAQDALKRFPELVDFIVVHQYMGKIRTYEQYLEYHRPFLDRPRQTLGIIDQLAPASRRATTEILLTEFSSFCAGAKQVDPKRSANNILNALITFEMLAEGVSVDDRVRFLHFWVTHSPFRRGSTDYANAFAPDNTVLPQGHAIEIMGRFIQDRMVQVQCPPGPIRCWASAAKDSTHLAVWLVNRSQQTKCVTVKLAGAPNADAWSTWSLGGSNPNDTQPIWGAGKAVTINRDTAAITLPPLSITVLYNMNLTQRTTK